MFVLKPRQINALRKRRGLTYKRLAGAMGVSSVSVHFWISGKHFPNAKHNARLLHLLLG